MAQWYDKFDGPANVELGKVWQVQNGGFHILRETSPVAGGRDINRLRADNVVVANEQRISHVLPSELDLSVSVSWRFILRHSAPTVAGKLIRVFLFGNEVDPVWNSAGANAYALQIGWNTNTVWLTRFTGGGGNIDVGTGNWAQDTNDHLFEVTREVSGANRFWRVYYDGSLIIGPTNDATYTTGTHIGFVASERNLIAEYSITS